jgi:hypothetical protein
MSLGACVVPWRWISEQRQQGGKPRLVCRPLVSPQQLRKGNRK